VKQQQGLSMLELIVVVAILGVLSTVGLLNIRRDTPQVREATRILAADLMRTRTEAIRLNTPVTLSVNKDTDSYTMFIDSDCNHAADAGTTALMQRTVTGDFPLADITTTFAICFDVRGLPNGNANGSINVISKQDSSYALSVAIRSQGKIEVN
jgi:prepilin-type N-terminal cleavage/methylation domain-containing protein